jgi:MFS family permease
VRATFISLRTRNFRLFFIGQTISNTGNWLTNIALTLLVLNLTDSGTAIGLLAACQYGPMLIISVFAGALVDRYDKRRFLLLTQMTEMAQSVGLAVLAFLPNPPIAGLFALAICGGIALSFDNPLRRSFVSEMVPPEDIPNAVVLYSTIVNTSRIIGPALAGVLVTTAGYGWAFLLDAVSYLAVLICLVLMRPDELYRRQRSGRTGGTVGEGIRYIASTPNLWIPFLMLSVIGTLAYNFTVTLPLFVTKALDGSDQQYTVLYSVFSVGAIACALFIASRSMVSLRHIVRGAAILGVTMLLLGLAPGFVTALPAVFLVGIGGILYMTATTTNFQIEAKPEMHGRVLALQSAALIGTSAIGGPLLGGLSDVFGARVLIEFGGLVCLVSAVGGYLCIRRYIEAGDNDGQQHGTQLTKA